MKHFYFILFILPIVAFAQTKKDYEHAMGKFMKYYNLYQGDSIRHMWPSNMWQTLANDWNPTELKSLHDQFGELKSYTYVGIDVEDPDKVIVFKTVYSKAGEKTTSLTLDKENQLGDFRFITSSPGIDKLLKKGK